MKSIIIFLVLIIPSSGLTAQQLERSLLTSAGTQTASGGIKLEWSIGEPLVAFFSNNDNQISQGFHQGVDIIDNIYSPPEWSLSLSIAPNPVSHHLYFKVNSSQILQIEIYDMVGRLIQKNSWTGLQKTLNVQSFSNGLYLIKIIDNTGQFASYKFVKQ